MKNIKNQYTYKNNKWLITTAMITLSIFNIKPVQAEPDIENGEEINAIEEQTESQSLEDSTKSEDMTDEENLEEESSKEAINNYNEAIENILPLLDTEQEQAFNDFLSEENEITKLFKETVLAHQLNEFTQADELYEELLDSFSDSSNNYIVELIEHFQNLAKAEQDLLNTEYLMNELTDKSEEMHEIGNTDEVSDTEEPKEEVEQETEEESNEETEQGVTEETDQEPNTAIFSVQTSQQTAEDLYNQILNAKGVSGAWSLAEEFKEKFPDHALLEEAVNYAAQLNLDYGIKLHQRGEYADATFYYNRITNATFASDTLKHKAGVYLKQAVSNQEMLTPTDYYNQILSAKGISGAWNLVGEFKAVFPEDDLLEEAINYVAELNLNYGIKLHERGEYTDAASYYERVVNETAASDNLKTTAQAYLNQANSDQALTTPTDYYDQIKDAKGISGAWNLTNEFKANFPNDALLEEAINYVAQLNLDYGMKLHERGEYTDAASYYERVVNETAASDNLKSAAQAYLSQANSDRALTTPADYYDQIKNAKAVSSAWSLAQEFKTNFPHDALLEEAVNHAAQLNLDYGVKLHGREEYADAASYYERVINETLASANLKSTAQVYLNQANLDQILTTPKDYYDQVVNAKGVSGAWTLAQEFKSNFPHDKLADEAFDYAVQLHLDYGMKLHKRGEYINAKAYYDRLLESPLVSSAIKDNAKIYQRQADAKQELTTADDYYKQVQSSKLVSEAWNLAQKFKSDFPTDSRVKTALNIAAEMNLNYAMKLHGQSNFKAAAEYYERLFNEENVESSIKIKAELYNYLAINELHLGETAVNYSKYNTTLNQAINIQTSSSTKPQASKVGGGFRDATKDEVAYYIDPNNFLPTGSNSLIEALSSVQITVSTLNVRTGPGTMYNQIGTVHNGEVFTIIDIENGWYKVSKNGKTGWISGNQGYVYRNNEILQFLDLSKPMGIPVTELNAYLQGYGILSGEGEAFSKASQTTKINELYLISHALLETGNGTSKLATGILVDEVNGQKVEPKVVYNMFGIGAYDSNPNKFGSERAYQEGWFTPEAAIIGGAKWVAENYIHNPHHQQNTLYEMRWNPASPGTHQYATDVAWAIKQTNRILNEAVILAQKHELVLVFDIPEYK